MLQRISCFASYDKDVHLGALARRFVEMACSSDTLVYTLFFTEILSTGHVMRTVNAGEVREKLALLLDEVASGEVIIVMRHGKPAARLTPIPPESVTFPDRSELRTSLPPSQESAAVTIRALRDDDRY